jgi:hypothetical protein
MGTRGRVDGSGVMLQAGSSDEDIDSLFPTLPKPSTRTMALGFTQPLTEMSTERSF